MKRHTDVAIDYAVWRLQRQGVLIRGGRGIYHIVTPGESDAFLKDPIEAIVSLLGKRVIFSYGTALYLHGLSRYGRLSEYCVLSPQDRKPKRLGEVVVRYIEAPVREDVGVMQRKFGRFLLCVTDLERTLIDCIHRPKYTQGWENVIHALDRAKRVKAHKLIEYVKQYRTPLLVAKVGLVLEQYQQKWRISREEIASLRPYLPRTPVSFERGRGGKLNKDWNLRVPEGLFNE